MSLLYLESEMNMPAMKLPLRCTLVKTTQGVVMISPIDFTPKQLEQIARFGEVRALVAPSLLHHKFMLPAIEKWPGAMLWAAPGLKEKCPDIPWEKILTEDAWNFADEIEILAVKGLKKMSEVAFFYKSERTLIVTDLCFNLEHPHGWGAGLLLRIIGAYKKFAVSRLVGRFTQDKKAFQDSMRTLFRWNFDRIVMAHGEVVEHNGQALLRRALEEKHYL